MPAPHFVTSADGHGIRQRQTNSGLLDSLIYNSTTEPLQNDMAILNGPFKCFKPL